MRYAALALVLVACSGSQRQKVAAVTLDVEKCTDKMTSAVFASNGCNEAQFKIDSLIETDPVCKGFGHFMVCGLLDGGKRDY